MPRFIVLDLAFELAEQSAPLLRALERRNRSLADQLLRALTSVVSNLAEGGRRIGKDRLPHFRTAEGSAAEAHAQLRLAAMFGHLPKADVQPLIALSDRVTAMCYGLTRDHQRGGARVARVPPLEEPPTEESSPGDPPAPSSES